VRVVWSHWLADTEPPQIRGQVLIWAWHQLNLSVSVTLLMLKPVVPGDVVGEVAKAEPVLVAAEPAAELELFWAVAKATRADATVRAARANMLRVVR